MELISTFDDIRAFRLDTESFCVKESWM